MVKTGKPNIWIIAQTCPWFCSTMRITALTASSTVIEDVSGTIKQAGQEVLPISDSDNSLGQTVILIDKIDFLINTKAWTRPHINLIPIMWSQMSTLHTLRALSIQNRLWFQKSLQVKWVLKFATNENIQVNKNRMKTELTAINSKAENYCPFAESSTKCSNKGNFTYVKLLVKLWGLLSKL